MGNYVKNDRQLTALLMHFFERLSTRCDQSNVDGNYLANVAKTLSTQGESFFANLPVSSYGVLETPCKSNLPSFIQPDIILHRVYESLDMKREAAIQSQLFDGNMSYFKPSEYAAEVLSSYWPTTRYGVIRYDGEGAFPIPLGKRHPYRIARDALAHAAQSDNGTLYDKALEAIEWYIAIDTSLLEINKRIELIYEGDRDLNAVWLRETLEKLNPYSRHFDPNRDTDFRFEEKGITPATIGLYNEAT